MVYRYRFDIPLSPPDALARLESATRPNLSEAQSFRLVSEPKIDRAHVFVGSVKLNRFRIHRDFRGRNSFVPLIWGRVVPIYSGAQVIVTMFMHPFVALIMAFWLSFVGYGALREFYRHSTDLFIPLGMFLFGLTLSLVAFLSEISKAKRLLREVLSNSHGWTTDTTN